MLSFVENSEAEYRALSPCSAARGVGRLKSMPLLTQVNYVHKQEAAGRWAYAWAQITRYPLALEARRRKS